VVVDEIDEIDASELSSIGQGFVVFPDEEAGTEQGTADLQTPFLLIGHGGFWVHSDALAEPWMMTRTAMDSFLNAVCYDGTCNASDGPGSDGPGQVMCVAVGSTVKNMGKERIGLRCCGAGEANVRDWTLVEDRRRFAHRKQCRLSRKAILCSSQAQQFDERAEANRDLAVMGIGVLEPAIKLAEKRYLVRDGKIHQPRLAIVRVRRENCERQCPSPRIAANFSRFRPRQTCRCRITGHGPRSCAGGSNDDTATKDLLDLPTISHEASPCLIGYRIA